MTKAQRRNRFIEALMLTRSQARAREVRRAAGDGKVSARKLHIMLMQAYGAGLIDAWDTEDGKALEVIK